MISLQASAGITVFFLNTLQDTFNFNELCQKHFQDRLHHCKKQQLEDITQADRCRLKVIYVTLLVLPAELRIPVHGVNVKEHGATGVGDVCAVDASVPASRQALQKITPFITSVHQML